jgi:hypothetical protein
VLARIDPPEAMVEAPQPALAAGDEPFAANPAAAFLPLLHAVLSGRPERVVVPGVSGAWRFTVTPCGEPRS